MVGAMFDNNVAPCTDKHQVGRRSLEPAPVRNCKAPRRAPRRIAWRTLVVLVLVVGIVQPSFLQPATLRGLAADTAVLFVALAIGAVAGLASGIVHVRLKIPSFIATLAMGGVLYSAALVISRERSITLDESGRVVFEDGATLYRSRAIGTRALAHPFLPVLHIVGLDNVVAVSDLRPVSDVALFFELLNGRFYGFGSRVSACNCNPGQRNIVNVPGAIGQLPVEHDLERRRLGRRSPQLVAREDADKLFVVVQNR